MNIQWYPGHMTKTKRIITENLSLVDVVIELLDARVPLSSKNPDIDILAKGKHRIIVLNKADLADKKINEQWQHFFEQQNFSCVIADSSLGKGINDIVSAARLLMKEKIERQRQRGRIFVPIRAMIVGIPNVGKSTLINKFVGKATAKTGDKPGVTKGKQWVKIVKDFDILDTPGILWHKFDDPAVGIKLAITGAINDDILDKHNLSIELIKLILELNPNCLKQRYKITFDENTVPYEILKAIGSARGFIKKGGDVDLDRTSIILIDEFRGNKLGCISLEVPN